MKKILFFIFFTSIASCVLAQPIQVEIFQKEAIGSTAKVGFRARATGANVDYFGVSFMLLYQSANAAPQSTNQNTAVGVDDSKLVTEFGWGISARNTNPAFTVNIDPGAPGGAVYNRAYIYGNVDETVGANIRTLTGAWDTLLYITLNTLQPVFPQGGFAFQQNTTDQATVGFISPAFATVPFSVSSGEIPLGASVVPVLFSKFDATCSPNGTLISWKTAQESNSNYFEVQRSVDGNTWVSLGRTTAAGNSSTDRAYYQIDLEAGNAMYRIKQVDKDGQFIYTGIERANCQVKNITSLIYPVPAQTELNVVIKSDRAMSTQLVIFDATGRAVRRENVAIQNGSNNFKINLNGLSSGEYLLKSTNAELDLRKQFSIIR